VTLADLNEIAVFARVVQTGSFTAAAAALHMPKSTVSRKVTELESRLQARLLQRTTRQLNLTDAGRTYYAYCARIVAEIDEAELAIGRLQETPRGLLRVTIPLNFTTLWPVLTDFAKRCPEVTLDVVSTDRQVDLVSEGFDVAIRAGKLADSSLIARPLASVQRIVMASPRYLKRRGRPRVPADLEKHDALAFGVGATPTTWQLQSGSTTVSIDIKPRFTINDLDALRQAACADLGVTLLPIFLGVEEARLRRLERILKEWSSVPNVIHAVYPSTRHLSPKVRAFVEHLQEKFTPPPWELGPAP